jgi:hypothetical protein
MGTRLKRQHPITCMKPRLGGAGSVVSTHQRRVLAINYRAEVWHFKRLDPALGCQFRRACVRLFLHRRRASAAGGQSGSVSSASGFGATSTR